MSVKQDLDSMSAQELIAAYQLSEKRRAQARRSVTLVILGVIAIYVSLLWGTIRDFKVNHMSEFTAALGVEAVGLAPQVTADMRAMVNRLYPHYVSTFQMMFERDWPKIQAQGLKEMNALDEHARSRWPQIETEINNLVLTSEDVARDELGKFVSEADVQTIAIAYGEAIKGKVDVVLTTTLKDHVNVSKQIGENLEKMCATEPDIVKPIDMKTTLGMMLEVAGIEIQKGF
jgi:hypothetical protein